MKKLVTISREYGSGGRTIGKILAQKLEVPFYDKEELIDLAAERSGFSKELLAGAELKAKNSFAYNLSSALSFNEATSGSPLSVNEKLFWRPSRPFVKSEKRARLLLSDAVRIMYCGRSRG